MTSSYFLPCWSPKICFRYVISWFFITWSALASLTFSSFPLSGNTPYRSRPTTLSPLTASALALSPSVKIRVQCWEFLPPASFASSSFGIPVSLVFLLPSCFLSCLLSLKSRKFKIISTTPVFSNFFTNESLRSHLEPNALTLRVKFSLV